MRILTTTAVALSLVTAPAVAAGLAGRDPVRATADRVETLRFTDKVNAARNIDIDAGEPGFSVGNQQVFMDDLYQDGKWVGTSSGVSEIVALDPTHLSGQATVTVTLPEGTLTGQLAFTEVLADGPPDGIVLAITGGTGKYRGASGECISHQMPGTDDTTVTCTIQR